MTQRLTATPITFEGQARAAPHAHLGQPDLRFWWSRFMWQNLEEHGVDCQEWLLPVIRGSAEIRTIYVGAMQVRAALISRLTCLRAGTRFNARGIDDEGNAANFVETEQVSVGTGVALKCGCSRRTSPSSDYLRQQPDYGVYTDARLRAHLLGAAWVECKTAKQMRFRVLLIPSPPPLDLRPPGRPTPRAPDARV